MNPFDDVSYRVHQELEQKIETYEQVLHNIQLYRDVCMDPKLLNEQLDRICSWSYAHRRGNGEGDTVQAVINQFHRLLIKKEEL